MTGRLVSVLIPTHQRPQLLAAAIASVRAQTYEPVEVIVVHDGDHVRPHSYREGSGLSFHVIAKAGLSAAVNHAFRHAAGDFVTVLADDDLMKPDKLRVLAGVLEEDPAADVAFGLAGRLRGTEESDPLPVAVRWLRANPLVTAETIRRRRGLRVHGTATLYRREVWERAGPWDESLDCAEEWEFHLRLLALGMTFRGVECVTDLYRLHSGQKSTHNRKRRTAHRRATLDRINAKHAEAFRK